MTIFSKVLTNAKTHARKAWMPCYRKIYLLTHRSSSAGREKTQDCWKGQLPDERTCVKRESIGKDLPISDEITHLDGEVDVKRLP